MTAAARIVKRPLAADDPAGAIHLEFLGRAAHEFGKGAVDIQNLPVCIEDAHHGGRILINGRQFRLALAERLLRLFQIGDVPAHGLDLLKSPLRIKQPPVDKLQPMHLPRCGPHAVFDHDARMGWRKLPELRFDARHVFGQGHMRPLPPMQFPGRLAEKAAITLVNKRKRAIRPKTTDDLGLVFHHGPIALLALP